MADDEQLYRWRRRAKRGKVLATIVKTELERARTAVASLKTVSSNERLWSMTGNPIAEIDKAIETLERALIEFGE